MEAGKTPTDEQIEALLHLGSAQLCIDAEAIDEVDLIAHSRGQLQDHEKVRRHLDACPYCQAIVKEYQTLSGRPVSHRFRRAAPAIVAIAALVLVWIVFPRGKSPIANYRIAEIRGGLRTFMGTEPVQRGQPITFGRNALVEVLIRPSKPLEGKSRKSLKLGVFVEDDQGRVKEWPGEFVSVRKSADWPVFEVRAKGEMLFEQAGHYHLRFALGDARVLAELRKSVIDREPNWNQGALQVLDLECQYQTEPMP